MPSFGTAITPGGIFGELMPSCGRTIVAVAVLPPPPPPPPGGTTVGPDETKLSNCTEKLLSVPSLIPPAVSIVIVLSALHTPVVWSWVNSPVWKTTSTGPFVD